MHLAFPVPLAGSPLASVTISHNLQATLGISIMIEIDGLAAEPERLSALRRGAEEFVRRGGGMRVARWIWENSKSLVPGS